MVWARDGGKGAELGRAPAGGETAEGGGVGKAAPRVPEGLATPLIHGEAFT